MRLSETQDKLGSELQSTQREEATLWETVRSLEAAIEKESAREETATEKDALEPTLAEKRAQNEEARRSQKSRTRNP